MFAAGGDGCGVADDDVGPVRQISRGNHLGMRKAVAGLPDLRPLASERVVTFHRVAEAAARELAYGKGEREELFRRQRSRSGGDVGTVRLRIRHQGEFHDVRQCVAVRIGQRGGVAGVGEILHRQPGGEILLHRNGHGLLHSQVVEIGGGESDGGGAGGVAGGKRERARVHARGADGRIAAHRQPSEGGDGRDAGDGDELRCIVGISGSMGGDGHICESTVTRGGAPVADGLARDCEGRIHPAAGDASEDGEPAILTVEIRGVVVEAHEELAGGAIGVTAELGHADGAAEIAVGRIELILHRRIGGHSTRRCGGAESTALDDKARHTAVEDAVHEIAAIHVVHEVRDRERRGSAKEPEVHVSQTGGDPHRGGGVGVREPGAQRKAGGCGPALESLCRNALRHRSLRRPRLELIQPHADRGIYCLHRRAVVGGDIDHGIARRAGGSAADVAGGGVHRQAGGEVRRIVAGGGIGGVARLEADIVRKWLAERRGVSGRADDFRRRAQRDDIGRAAEIGVTSGRASEGVNGPLHVEAAVRRQIGY